MRQNPYVGPTQSSSYPKGLTLVQFLQTVVVGISGLPGNLVRPKWQPEPPKQPDITTDWLAFGIESQKPDFSAYLSATGPDHELQLNRQEDLTLSFSIYGPNCAETYGLISDGFQIPQNRISLFQANIGYTEISEARHVPDLVNQRWVDRVECTVRLKRQIQRTYPVLTFVSVSGIIYVPDIADDAEIDWEVSK
jgi:hypothetical protein